MGCRHSVVQYRWWHVPPHFWAISVLLFSGMANLWRYRRWGRRVCYHQYYCIVQPLVHLGSSVQVPVAFHHCSKRSSSDRHARSAEKRRGTYYMAMSERRPALDPRSRGRVGRQRLHAHGFLYRRCSNPLDRLCRCSSSGSCFPGLHAFLELEIL